MQCPINRTEMVLAERNGVGIDYFPKCRGVWPDLGEPVMITDRSAAATGTRQAHADQRENAGRGHHPCNKRGGFLQELFDL